MRSDQDFDIVGHDITGGAYVDLTEDECRAECETASGPLPLPFSAGGHLGSLTSEPLQLASALLLATSLRLPLSPSATSRPASTR